MSTTVPALDNEALVPIKKLSKDLAVAAKVLTHNEARYLVDIYYQLQEVRKASSNQIASMVKTNEPVSLLEWFRDNAEGLEGQIRRALDKYSDNHRVGRWSKSIIGVGPVIAAGLLGHIKLEWDDKEGGHHLASTVGHIWRFAGLDPTMVWEKKQRRPYNADLKVLTWKIGQSFLKMSNNEDCLYGKLLRQRMHQERQRNAEGLFADQARAKLVKYNIDKKTDAYKWYSGAFSPRVVKSYLAAEQSFSESTTRMLPTVKEMAEIREMYQAEVPKNAIVGNEMQKRLTKAMKAAGWNSVREWPIEDGVPMLPLAHTLQRACRYATKLFFAHWHHVAWESAYGKPPVKPYVFEHLEGHTGYVAPPNWPCA